ncbi:hypothetical protein FA95DRAFT_1576687 [Auriscalpium vulgare]|uniref:Uncharacterized protein n=1 Tax=Auriscalpium vulgare TaxID=40419 RepID=A0ACB8RA61_9AGAM|nr:hypothetical protein FA95DRAFT_1576687 [Auriscalpium vulgare]
MARLAVAELSSDEDIDEAIPPLDEAHNDFWGLPSNPLSIYHTGLAWPLPTGPEASRVPKEARPVRIHAIVAVWYQLGERIYKYFDSRDKVFLLTARHVVSEYDNKPYHKLYHLKERSTVPVQVIHHGDRAIQKTLQDIMDKTDGHQRNVERIVSTLERLGDAFEGEGPKTAARRIILEDNIAKEEASKAALTEFSNHVAGSWFLVRQRILGHVLYAPPISVGTSEGRFTEDWALIELVREKFDWNAFQGNVIHLGKLMSDVNFMAKMYPHAETRAKVKYPVDGLMRLRGFVEHGGLRHPKMLDVNKDECPIVVKNGATTGATLGRATGIESFVREYKKYAISSTFMAVAVYPYSHKDGAFSAGGDSGSVVADANSRIVGMIIGGTGLLETTDVTYVMPSSFLFQRIKKAFPRYRIY